MDGRLGLACLVSHGSTPCSAADLAVGSLGFFITGWGLAFGPSGGDESSATPIMGTGDFALIGDVDFASWVFHLSFSATAATIVSGAVAGEDTEGGMGSG